MTKKIEIPKKILYNLYKTQNLSTHKIAKKFDCDPGVIQRRLREHNIKLKPQKLKVDISKKKLYDLYINKNLSTYKIAKLLGISSCCVYYKLKELNIKPRKKKIVNITKKELQLLYHKRGLSLSKIAKEYNCVNTVILSKMKKYGLKRRNASECNTTYPKKKFKGNRKLKAYMIGFRLGDLNVKSKDNNHTIFVKSNTTKKEQYNLIKTVYGIYGHFRCNINKGVYYIWCNLDKSFSFLVDKEDKIKEWILKNDKLFFSFLGGYTDAEGNIQVSKKIARFRIRSYDKNILFKISKKLNSININARFTLASKKGIYNNRKQNKDCWCVSVGSKNSLSRLLKLLKPYIKHKKRYSDLLLAEKNVLERIKKGEIIS